MRPWIRRYLFWRKLVITRRSWQLQSSYFACADLWTCWIRFWYSRSPKLTKMICFWQSPFSFFPEAYGAGFPFSRLCVPQQTSHCAPAASVSLTGLAREFHGSENAAEACEWYGWRRGPWQTVSLAGLRGVLHLSAEDCQWCGCHNRLWSTASLAWHWDRISNFSLFCHQNVTFVL